MANSYVYSSTDPGCNVDLVALVTPPEDTSGLLKIERVVQSGTSFPYAEPSLAIPATTSVAGDYQPGSIYLSQIAGEGNASGALLRGTTTTGLWELYGIANGDIGKALIVSSDTPGSEQFAWTTIPAEFTWNEVSGTSQTLAPGQGYVAKNVALTTFTLPATASFGDTFKVLGYTAGGWRINPGTATQVIRVGNLATTLATGYVASVDLGDGLELICIDDTTPGSEVFAPPVSGQGNLDVQ